jgi:hypothetical protein
MFVEPARRFRQAGNIGERVGRLGRGEVAQDGRFALDWVVPLADLDDEHPFVDDLPKPIDDAGSVQIDPRRHFVSEREEAGPLLEVLLRGMKGVPSDRLEERMAGRDPFQVMGVGRLAVGGESRILRQKGRQPPVRVPLVVLENVWRSARIVCVRERRHGLEGERREPDRVGQEAGDGLGDDPALLGLGPPLDQHLQVKPLGGQALQGVLADGPESALIHVMEEAVFEVGVTQMAGVVVAQNALNLGGGQYLTDDVKDRVVIQGVANLLKLV